MGRYIELKDLEVYKLSRKISALAWEIFEKLSWDDKKTIGFQFMESADSIGANIAEGYGRYHYLDKIRFYYNSRGSSLENMVHWLELLFERKRISEKEFENLKSLSEQFYFKLNNFIKATYDAKMKQNGK